MPRIARMSAPGVLHHVISRFVDRRWHFEDDVERRQYLAFLGRALQTTDWRCVAWCLMSNHIHLAMVGGWRPLESWAKKTHAPFAAWLNTRHGRLGPVFADRPAVYLVPAPREADVIAYIHNNPVRAHVVTTARRSSWSSHRAYLGVDVAPRWLDVATGLRRSGFERAQDFGAFVDGARRDVVALPDVVAVRRRAHRAGPFEVATPTLGTPIETPIVARDFVPARTTPARVLDVVAGHLGVAPIAATRRHARGDLGVAKRLVVHVGIELGISFAASAAILNISRQRSAVIARDALSPDEQAIADRALKELRRRGAESCQS